MKTDSRALSDGSDDAASPGISAGIDIQNIALSVILPSITLPPNVVAATSAIPAQQEAGTDAEVLAIAGNPSPESTPDAKTNLPIAAQPSPFAPDDVTESEISAEATPLPPGPTIQGSAFEMSLPSTLAPAATTTTSPEFGKIELPADPEPPDVPATTQAVQVPQVPSQPKVDGSPQSAIPSSDAVLPKAALEDSTLNPIAWASKVFGDKLRVNDDVVAPPRPVQATRAAETKSIHSPVLAPPVVSQVLDVDSLTVKSIPSEPAISANAVQFFSNKPLMSHGATQGPEGNQISNTGALADAITAPVTAGISADASKPAAPPEKASPVTDNPEKKPSNPSAPPSPEVIAPALSNREATTTNPVPLPTSSVVPSTPHAQTPEVRDIPWPHQMLDSAPSPSFVSQPAARVFADSGGDVQMRVGIHTTAFGTVEIQTTLHQNQVGLSVHGEGGLARWFSSEVQNIETGLKDYRLNLANVQLDGGSAGLQTATSFHHEQQPRSFTPNTGLGSSPSLSETSREAEPVEILVTDLPIRSADGRVSIRV